MKHEGGLGRAEDVSGWQENQIANCQVEVFRHGNFPGSSFYFICALSLYQGGFCQIKASLHIRSSPLRHSLLVVTVLGIPEEEGIHCISRRNCETFVFHVVDQ